MVQQVRLKETFTVQGSTSTGTRIVFGFGTHPDALEGEAHPVTTATPLGNKLRVIVDEILVGNHLEEIACRGPVDVDAYSRVPLGATPDDIARCSTAQDVLPSTCTGPLAPCICENDAGCPVGNETIAKGAPVGVLDINQDGSADDTRLIAGAASVRCGAIDVPLDLDMSYWNPSGNQLVPAAGGFDALGPALVLVPQAGLPTNLNCNLVFSSEVVDKQGNAVCAPPGGDILQACSPGDTSAVTFKVEPLRFEPDVPDGATGVSRTDPGIFIANMTLDPATLSGITVTEGAGNTPYTAFTAALQMNRNVIITWTNGLAANTQYRITFPTTITDTFGQSPPQPYVITFTTGA